MSKDVELSSLPKSSMELREWESPRVVTGAATKNKLMCYLSGLQRIARKHESGQALDTVKEKLVEERGA